MRLYNTEINRVSNHFIFEDLTLVARKRILGSPNPIEAMKASSAAWKRKGKVLGKNEYDRLKGDSLETLRRSHGVFLKKPVDIDSVLSASVSNEQVRLEMMTLEENNRYRGNIKSKRREKAILRDDPRLGAIRAKQIHSAKRSAKQRESRFQARNRVDDVTGLKIKNKNVTKAKQKVESRHFVGDAQRTKQKSRSIRMRKERATDKFLDRNIARIKHSERGGSGVHPRKKAQIAKRKAFVTQKVKNVIYSENILQAHRTRREKRIAKRKRDRADKKKVLITPESGKIAYFESFRSFVEDLFDSAPKSVLWDAFVDYSVATLNWLYQLYRGTTVAHYMSACMSFLMALGLKIGHSLGWITSFCTFFFEHMRNLKNKILPESLSSHMEFISVLFSRVESSEFVQRVRDLVLSVLSFKLFDKDITRSIYRVIGAPPKGTILEILTAIYNGLIYLVQFGERLLRGEPLSQVLASTDPVTSSMDAVKALLARENMTYSGTPVEGFTDVVDYFHEICELISDMEEIHKTISRLDKNLRWFRLSIDSLYRLKARVDKNFRGGRVAPVAIVLHGPPGIGKSEIIKYFARVFSRTRGREFDESHIFSRTLCSDYMEGYSHQTPIIHYSELGNKVPALIKAQGDPLLPELQSLIDSLPFSANMAFDDKGKMFMTPELILIDTNNKLMNSEYVIADQGAFLRRFEFVEASVKPEFRVSGSVSLDREKSLSAPGHILDRYDFTVTKFIPSSDPKKPREETRMSGDLRDVTIYLSRLFAEHLTKQTRLTARLAQSYEWEIIGFEDEKYHDDEKDHLPDYERVVVNPESFRLPGSGISISDYTSYGLDVFKTFVVVMLLYSLSSLWFTVTPVRRSMIRSFALAIVLLLLFTEHFKVQSLLLTIFVLFLESNSYFDRDYVLSIYAQRKSYLHYLLFGGAYNPFYSTMWFKYAGVATIAISIIALVARMVKYGVKFQSESLVSVSSSGVYEKYNFIEEEMKLMPNRARVKDTEHAVWNTVMDVNLAKIVNTHDARTLDPILTRNLRLVRTGNSVADYELTYIFGVSSTLAVINRHALRADGETTLLVSKNSTRHDFQPDGGREIRVTEQNSYYMGSDLVLFDTGMYHFKDITKHLLADFPTFANATGRFCGSPVKITKTLNGVLSDNKWGDLELPLCFSYDYPSHEPGMCGIPLCIDHNGSSAILGLHVGGIPGSVKAFASPLVRSEIEKGKAVLADKINLIQPHSFHICPEFDTEAPIRKSVFKHETLPYVDYFGKTVGPVMINDKSTNVRAKGHMELSSSLERAGIKKEADFLPPMMKPCKRRNGEYVSPYNNFYRKLNKTAPQLDWEVLGKVVEMYTNRILLLLRERGISAISPLTLDDAINGVDNDPFTRRVNASTAAGFGFAGKKEKYIPLVGETQREPTPELVDRLIEIIQCYREGVTVTPVNKGSLKDEMRPVEKALSGATRVFFITPIDFLIISRKMLSPFYTLMVENGDVFGCSVGIDMHRGADRFIRDLTDFSPFLLEGDYSGYDISTPPDIARAASTVVYNVCKALGYTDLCMKVVNGILSDDLFPMMELCKDLFSKPGVVASGRYATAESNSLRGVIFLMYAWYKNPDTRDFDFFEKVRPVTYGDDVLAAIKEDVLDRFNSVKYGLMCQEYFNMKFTSAAKNEVSSEYETLDTCSFLKRTFSLYTNGKYVAKLDSSSIHRAVQWINPSKVVTECDQTVGCLRSMLYESFFHTDEENFNVVRDAFVLNLTEYHGVGERAAMDLLPTYRNIFVSIFGEE